jgi:hypothetical protein
MHSLYISLACLNIFGIAAMVVAMRKSPYAKEDEKGFHVIGASPSPRGGNVSENPATSRRSKRRPSEWRVQHV